MEIFFFPVGEQQLPTGAIRPNDTFDTAPRLAAMPSFAQQHAQDTADMSTDLMERLIRGTRSHDRVPGVC